MAKKTEETFTSVPVGKIVSESNRKHGGMGNIEVLSGSIKTEGLINPPTVTALPDGNYRVVAGRRRIEAVRQLKWKEVPVRVISEADAARLESIALAENVNRQEMHPLDEAETFKKLLDKGTAAEDIAAYYDRTVAGIHHRVRLCDLIDGVKEMFRDGKIALSGAALVAGFPPEDQEKFLKKYGGKGADKWGIYEFLRKAQAFPLTAVADEKCAVCGKRTHNAAPGLFDEEYSGLEDTCLDGECYAGKWQNLILHHIVESGNEGNTEHKIILDRGLPRFLPAKTAAVTLEKDEYTLLAPDKHFWEKTNKKSKKDTAWVVSMEERKVKVARVKYEKHERTTYSSYNTPSDPVKDYLIDQVPDIRPEDRKAAAEKVSAKYNGAWNFRNEVLEKVLNAVIAKRLQEESRENIMALYLAARYSGPDENDEESILDIADDDNREIFSAIFGPEGIAKISEIPGNPLTQKVFLFLTATSLRTNDLPRPNYDDGQWERAEHTLLWHFAQMGREEYIRLYQDILAETVREAENLESSGPEGGDEDETDDPLEDEE